MARLKSLLGITMYMQFSCIGLLIPKLQLKYNLLLFKYFFGLFILILKPNTTHNINIYDFLHQALHYNQIYNFALNHDHKFRNIIIIKTIKIKINNIIVDALKRSNTTCT